MSKAETPRLTLGDIPPEMLAQHVEYRLAWYQVVYNLAAHHTHSALRDHERQSFHYRLASRYATLLSASAAMTLLDLGQAETWRVSRSRLVASGHRRELRFARFLQDVGEPTALVLAAAVSRHTASEPGDARPVDSTSLRRAAAGARGALLELLALVRSDDRELANRAARAIVENVEHRPLSYRSRYNLACFYSAEDIELSLYYLRRALETAPPGERRSLARWAWSDPSLEATRSRARERVISLTSFAVPAQDIELLVDEYLHRGEDGQS